MSDPRAPLAEPLTVDECSQLQALFTKATGEALQLPPAQSHSNWADEFAIAATRLQRRIQEQKTAGNPIARTAQWH